MRFRWTRCSTESVSRSPSFSFYRFLSSISNGDEGDPGKLGRSLIYSKHNAHLSSPSSSSSLINVPFLFSTFGLVPNEDLDLEHDFKCLFETLESFEMHSQVRTTAASHAWRCVASLFASCLSLHLALARSQPCPAPLSRHCSLPVSSQSSRKRQLPRLPSYKLACAVVKERRLATGLSASRCLSADPGPCSNSGSDRVSCRCCV